MKKLEEMVPLDEILNVQGTSNFGSMSPREIVNDGVFKVLMGYACGSTQLSILQKLKMISNESIYNPSLTEKGMEYARELINLYLQNRNYEVTCT